MPKDNLRILLAEDSPTDAELAKAAFRRTDMHVDLDVVTDGVEALHYVRSEKGYDAKPRPDFIILDLNMPKKGGMQTLKELKADPKLKTIPVVILTTSADEFDVEQAYEHAASCYIVKPVDFAEFESTSKAIKDFYFSIATLPTGKSHL